MNSSSPENPNGKKYSPVFIDSAIVVAIVVLLGAFLPEQFTMLPKTTLKCGLQKS
ncbi:hypothetical protein ACVNP1_11085 [Staphylococcus aureus]